MDRDSNDESLSFQSLRIVFPVKNVDDERRKKRKKKNERSFPADSNERRQDPEKIPRGSSFSLGIIAAMVGSLMGMSISLMLLVIILRRRKTYKRGTNGSALSEDSDVRFLTSDEILDFTLARPSDNDET